MGFGVHQNRKKQEESDEDEEVEEPEAGSQPDYSRERKKRDSIGSEEISEDLLASRED